MKNLGKLKIVLLLFVMFFSFVWNAFAYKELLIENRGGKPIRVIKVVLDWQDFVITSVANDWWDTLENLVKKVWWDSGINWTFFCPADYSYCGWVTHSNYERVYLWNWAKYSSFWPDTSVRVIFGFDIEWNPLVVQNKVLDWDDWLWTNINRKKINDIEFGLSNYTVLLLEWENIVDINVNPMRSRYSSNMASSANRNFICSTKDWSTIYMWVVWWISIVKLADYVEKYFWCYNALALDAWASEAMVYEWNVLARSSRRKIMDAFVVVDRDTYIKLTWYTPKNNSPYTPENQYELTAKDKKMINTFDEVLKELVQQEWSSFKNVEKKLIREAISSDKFKYNYQKKAIFHELLIRLFTIDKI